MTKLTDNYSLEEFTTSSSHPEFNDDNLRDALRFKASGIKLASNLESISAKYGSKFIVTSGHRCAGLNKAVGGSQHSQHMLFEAADGHFTGEDGRPRLSDDELMEDLQFIRTAGVAWHQLLIEPRAGHGCLHFSLAKGYNDLQVAYYSVPTKTMVRIA